MRGERRRGIAVSGDGELVGGALGCGTAAAGVSGTVCVVGVTIGGVTPGGMLFRVCRKCMRGAVRVMSGAVGLDVVWVSL